MRRSGVRIPLAPPQADIRSGCRFFVCQAWCCGAWLLCCLWRRWCSGGRTCCPVGRAAGCARGRRPARGHWAGLLVAPRVFRAPEGPAAREARRPHFVRRRASKPARALRTLRRPPHLWGRVAVRQLYASARCPARPCHCPLAPQPGPAGLASGPRAHRCWAYTECRMQFPRDLFEP